MNSMVPVGRLQPKDPPVEPYKDAVAELKWIVRVIEITKRWHAA